MRKICKLIFAVILASTVTTISYSAELNELQIKKDEVQSQMDESQKTLESVDKELTQNLQKIQELDENILNNETSLEKINKEISQKEEELSKIQQELKIVSEDYKNQKELLNTRLITIYETPNLKYLDVVLGSEGITDFISTYYLLSEITSYDIELLEKVEKEKNEIEEKNKIIVSQKEELESQRRTATKTQIALTNSKILRNIAISKLTEEEQKVQAQIDEYNKQINDIENEIKRLAITITFGEDYLGGEMKWPINGYYTVTSNYGMRVHPITGIYKLHTGVDIGAPMGAEFTAMAKGVVVKAEYNGAYGNMVIIDHGGGVQTLYAHGSEIVTKVGEEVEAGQTVLKVGSTGYSTGPHAHFEVRIKGETVNPLDYVHIPQ